MTKKIIIVLVIVLLISCGITIIALAHSGGTDSSGGHTNHSTGEYHYHHGYSAHQHPNGVCPYRNDDGKENSDNVIMIVFMTLITTLTATAWLVSLLEIVKNETCQNIIQVTAYLLTILCGICLFVNVELMFVIILAEVLLAYIIVKIINHKNNKE